MDISQVDVTFTLYEDQLNFLKNMVEKYDLPDESKALRILIDFARTEGDLEQIFTEIRCTHCG